MQNKAKKFQFLLRKQKSNSLIHPPPPPPTPSPPPHPPLIMPTPNAHTYNPSPEIHATSSPLPLLYLHTHILQTSPPNNALVQIGKRNLVLIMFFLLEGGIFWGEGGRGGYFFAEIDIKIFIKGRILNLDPLYMSIGPRCFIGGLGRAGRGPRGRGGGCLISIFKWASPSSPFHYMSYKRLFILYRISCIKSYLNK